jgi:hypothetical protein
MIKALEQLGGGADPAAVKRVMELTRNITDLEQQRLEVATQRARYESSGNAESLIRIQQQIEAARNELRGYTEVGANIEKRRGGVPRSSIALSPEWRSRASAMMDAADEERDRRNRERDFRPGFASPRSDDERLGAGSFGGFQPGDGAKNMDPLMDAMKSMGESFNGTFDQMATGATDASSIIVQAIGSITGALGSMVTNLIIAGDAGAAGAKKAAGNAMAGLSAQAFGFAILLEGMALAAALSGPILGWGAPGLAAAGGVMAGIGGALALTARGLGADKVGGAGASRGGGGSSSAAAGTNPYQGTGGGSTQVVVMIGGEVVTRGVQVETRKQAQRGGISEPRMAMAS